MSKAGIVSKALDNPIQLALGVGIVLGLVYFLGRKLVGDAADFAGGLASGNNSLTAGTPYAGGGVIGTAAAAVNTASGGVLQAAGDSIGSWLYDAFNPQYDPNEGLSTGATVVRKAGENIDNLWGSVGQVALRRK